MKYYSGWSLTEFYNLPVGLRNWFVKRLSDQIEQENKKAEEANSKSSTSNTVSYTPTPTRK
jgi:hypothetical protein